MIKPKDRKVKSEFTYIFLSIRSKTLVQCPWTWLNLYIIMQNIGIHIRHIENFTVNITVISLLKSNEIYN